MKNESIQKSVAESWWTPLVAAVLVIAPVGTGATPLENPPPSTWRARNSESARPSPSPDISGMDGAQRADKTGVRTVCATMTQEFLEYSKSRGNDLMSPSPRYRFPGLKPGDQWCLCAARWLEAYRANLAPPVHLDESHQAALRIVPQEAPNNTPLPNPSRKRK